MNEERIGRYPFAHGYVLETTHGYYPLGAWGFAANLGDDRLQAESKLRWWLDKSPGEYRIYDNSTGEVIDAVSLNEP